MTTLNWGCSPPLGDLFGQDNTLEQLDSLHGQILYSKCEGLLDGEPNVASKYKQWIEHQRYHELYVFPFVLGYIEFIGWFTLLAYYVAFFANSAMGFFVMTILIISHVIHIIGISIAWKNTKKIGKILKRFSQYIIQLSEGKDDANKKNTDNNNNDSNNNTTNDENNENNENSICDSETLLYLKRNLHDKKNWEASIAFQRWNNLFRLHDSVEFLQDWHTFAFCLIKYVFSLSIILTLFGIEVATFCVQLLNCSTAAYDTAVVIYYIMLVISWLETNILHYLVMVCNNGMNARLASRLTCCLFVFVLIFYGVFVLILYTSDRDTAESAASGESNWLSDIAVPVIFGFAALVIVIWTYKQWKGYATWTRMIFFWLCLMEVFWAGSWRILLIGLFCMFILALCAYMDFQHRCHHAVTKMDQTKYQNDVCMTPHWIKESILTALIGQFSMPYVQVFRSDPIEQNDDNEDV